MAGYVWGGRNAHSPGNKGGHVYGYSTDYEKEVNNGYEKEISNGYEKEGYQLSVTNQIVNNHCRMDPSYAANVAAEHQGIEIKEQLNILAVNNQKLLEEIVRLNMEIEKLKALN